MESEGSQQIRFGEFELDPRRRRLSREGKTVSLNPKAFDLLVFLVQNGGRVISKDEILSDIWKDQFVEESNLAVQISSLRKALGDQTNKSRFLATIPGKGYQFIADVSYVGAAAETIATEPSSVDVLQPPSIKPSRRGTILVVVVSAAVLLIAGYFAVQFFLIGDRDEVRSVAVLPFVNQTVSPSPEYLGDGLAEGIIFSLSRIPGLRVMSRDSAFRYRDNPIDAKQVGTELGVQALLTGRISQIGEALSIQVELVSTTDSSVIWAGEFTRKLSEAEKLRVDVAASITRELEIKLTPPDEQSLHKNQSEVFEAYELYLIGRYHLNRSTDDGFFKGRDSFRLAIEKDPNYALAHAGLADAYNLLCGWGAVAPNEGYPLAKAAAVRALELDETLAEAHVSLGVVRLFYDADWVGAERDLRRAIEINPNYSDAHWMYGYRLMLTGRFDEAEPFLKRGVDLDPLSIVKVVSYGGLFYFQRDQKKAIDAYQKALDLDPNSGLAHWAIGNALLQSGRIDDAISEYQKAIPLSGDSPDEPASLAFAYAVKGNQTEARKIVEDLRARTRRGYIPPSLIASIYGALGEKDIAFDLLEQAFRERDSTLVYLKIDPMFDPLRDDPRFAALLTRIGLSP